MKNQRHLGLLLPWIKVANHHFLINGVPYMEQQGYKLNNKWKCPHNSNDNLESRILIIWDSTIWSYIIM